MRDKFFQYQEGKLADDRLELIEEWARKMTNHPVLGKLGMTMRQRRVVASFMWWREVCISNEHMGVRQQPPPIAGRDAKGRIVVQGYDRIYHDQLNMYALTKDGDPTDIWEPVISIRTGERIKVPEHARRERKY